MTKRTAPPLALMDITEAIEEIGRLRRRRELVADCGEGPADLKADWLNAADNGIAESLTELAMKEAVTDGGTDLVDFLLEKQERYVKDWLVELGEWRRRRATVPAAGDS